MKFSLTYPEYRLLDVKALSEYHAACVATDLDFVSDQSLLSLTDAKLRGLEEYVFKRFCDYFYQLSRLVDLDLYWELFHTIAHLGEGDHTINSSNLVLHYSIDLDDFLSLFIKFADIAFGPNSSHLYDALETMDITKHYVSGIPILDEIFELIGKLDSPEYNGVIAALGEQNVKKELDDKTLGYFIRELFFSLRPKEAKDTAEAKTVAFAAMTDITKYIRKSLIDSYNKIWFDGETTLSIYAELPSLREGLVIEANRKCNNAHVTYEALRSKYLMLVKRLTFSQDNNRTAVYEKYIAGQVIHGAQAHLIYNIEEQTSMIVSQSSDGKSCAAIDKPLNKTAAHKHDSAPIPTVASGTLLTDISKLDCDTEKGKIRSKLVVLSLPYLHRDFDYSTTALRKYPIMAKTGSAEPTWHYSHHPLCVHTSNQQEQGIIMERKLPMYHCVQDILGPELVAKQEAFAATWATICSQNGYKRRCSFVVNFADKEYLSGVTADASCRAESINKVRPHIQYVMSGTFKSDNWLYEAWRLNTITSQGNGVSSTATPEDFTAALKKLKREAKLNSLKRSTNDPMSEESIKRLSTCKKIVNEIYRLDAALKIDGYSFSKLWYMYLSDNFVRDENRTKSIINATEYIDNALALPAGYHPMPSRYGATDYANQHKPELDADSDKLVVHCMNTTLNGIMTKLARDTEGKQESAFTTLRQQVIDVKHNIIAAGDPGSLGTTPLQETKQFVSSMFNALTSNSNIIEMPERFLAKGDLADEVYVINDVGIQNCMRQGLQFLADFKMGEWAYDIRDINHFKILSSSNLVASKMGNTADKIIYLLNTSLEKEAESIMASDKSWETLMLLLQFPFLLISLLYTMTIEEYCAYRQLMATMGIPLASSANRVSDYEAGIGRDLMNIGILCKASALIISNYDNDKGRKLYTQWRLKYLEILPCFKAALLTLGLNTDKVLHTIHQRFIETNNIVNALSSEFQRCNKHLEMLTIACITATLKDDFKSIALLLELDSFGCYSAHALQHLDISSCTTQTATEDDIALLLGNALGESESESGEDTQEYQAVSFLQQFIDNPRNIMNIISNENFYNLSKCSYFVYMLGYLIHFMFKSAEMRQCIRNVIQDSLYLETDYRPYAVVNSETSEICTNIYRNLVYLLNNNLNDIAKILSIPGSNSILGSDTSIYNIATYGNSSYDRSMFDFISRSTASDTQSAGLIFAYCKPSKNRPEVPYYLHISGLYICGAQFDEADMTDVALYYSEDDINNSF